MTRHAMTGNCTAPGVVEIRLSGAPDDIEAAVALIPGLILMRRGPYPNRRDLGERLYLAVQIPGPGEAGPELEAG